MKSIIGIKNIGAALLVAIAILASLAGPAQAAGSVTVTNESGQAQADITYATTLNIKGSGFQSIAGAFGGIYVFFGWVSDPNGTGWAPSNGGIVGANYRYIPDLESKDNLGYQRFVSFPGSDTESTANGGILAADGTWSTQLVVPGASFEATDRNGNVTTVNCLEVQCGIITFGAHGVLNANNESFTPVSFADLQSGQAATTGPAPLAPTENQTQAQSGQPVNTATIAIDQAGVMAGQVLGFVAQGFTPGEQVMGVLDNGVVGLGPLTAGNQGEVAGVIELPEDLRVGTHVLHLTGAASKQSPQVEFTVVKDPVTVAALEAQAQAEVTSADGLGVPEIAVIVAGAILLLVVIVSLVTSLRRRHQQKQNQKQNPKHQLSGEKL